MPRVFLLLNLDFSFGMGEIRDLDFVLQDIVGGNGKWQWKVILLFQFPLSMVGAMPVFVHLFAAHPPDHRCFVVGCDTINSSFVEPWVNFSIPHEAHSQGFLDTDTHINPCQVFIRSRYQDCSKGSFSSQRASCSGYVYDRSVYEETLATKLDLVCDGKWKEQLLGTIMMLGLMVGSVVGGWMGDRLGRKRTIIASFAVLVPSLLLEGFSMNYAMYAVFRFLTACFMPPVWISTHSLSLEFYDRQSIKYCVGLKDIGNPIGNLLVLLIVYYNRHYTYIHIWTAAVGLVCALPIFLIPESVRWLAANGKSEEALKIYKDIARVNGRQLTEKDIAVIKETIYCFEHYDNDCSEKTLSYADLFRHEQLVHTIVLLINWITVNVGSYTLSLNATRIHGDLFTNFSLAQVCDIPGTILLFLMVDSFFGRKFTLITLQAILGLCCIALAFVPKSVTVAVLVPYLIGKSVVGASFWVIWLITAELYATNLRSQALGLMSTVARVFGLVTPFIAGLSSYWPPLPMIVLGVPVLFGAALALLIPETKGRSLPQNMDQATVLYGQTKEIQDEAKHRMKEVIDKEMHDFEGIESSL